MTISMDITKQVAIGQEPSTCVVVTALNATSDEMSFVSALTKKIKEFAETYHAKAGGAKEG